MHFSNGIFVEQAYRFTSCDGWLAHVRNNTSFPGMNDKAVCPYAPEDYARFDAVRKSTGEFYLLRYLLSICLARRDEQPKSTVSAYTSGGDNLLEQWQKELDDAALDFMCVGSPMPSDETAPVHQPMVKEGAASPKELHLALAWHCERAHVDENDPSEARRVLEILNCPSCDEDATWAVLSLDNPADMEIRSACLQPYRKLPPSAPLATVVNAASVRSVQQYVMYCPQADIMPP
jgi:hypothetical protein